MPGAEPVGPSARLDGGSRHHEILGAAHGHPHVADEPFLGSSEELLLQTWPRQDHIERHAGGMMHEGQDPTGLDEASRVGYPKVEVRGGEGRDQLLVDRFPRSTVTSTSALRRATP